MFLILFLFSLYLSYVNVHIFPILQIKPEEFTAIMSDFDAPGSLATNGLYLGGTKFMVIQGEPGAVIRGKKVSFLFASTICYNASLFLYKKIDFQGSSGVTIKKTNMALIFGIYDESMTGGECNMVVERLGDYLCDQGF
ncbi:hypothetical protein ZIOFF_005369 [Zingiber officinale]|uniref:Profilin n=1 Tax=Zingiber officinale TaxID=94328 RepID=A0A8J5I9V1_ZINOF|nr:hypothetical protein ZIOFF_005369 [Zingiber officinale]